MKKTIFSLAFILMLQCSLNIEQCFCQPVHLPKSGLVISNLTYDSIKQNSITVFWTTDLPSDSKIKWMAPDSNYQPLIFTDSIYNPALTTNHVQIITNLQPATIYKYNVISQNTGGSTLDSGYFVTQSLSSGSVDIYFNHSVDLTVSTGEFANGNQNFESLYIKQIDSAKHSIDITLWEFAYYNSISTALINAKKRGVKIRFVYNHTAFTPQIDSMIAHGIPVIQRKYDTIFSMHNKFWIFDYRYNNNPNNKYLLTGSTNVSHAQFHQDRNNIITVQDESLCAVYTREFEEMWGSHTDQFDKVRAKFGSQKVDNVPHILNVAGTRMEAYFSPSDSVSVFLNNLILTKPTHSLYFCMLKFELPVIENALHTDFNNGIQIEGVFDSTDSFLANSAYPRMKGLPVLNTWNPAADVFIDTIVGLIHHKYMITDADIPGGNKVISTGSFNWEVPAETGNDENSLTIFDDRINNLYYQEFSQRYIESGGESIVTGNTKQESLQESSFVQNYPNPFVTKTNIKFYVSEERDVKIVVYDFMGREVETLVNKTLTPGIYQLSFDGSLLMSGVYFCKFSTNNYSETRRMMLVK